jgi:hypothetical protein
VVNIFPSRDSTCHFVIHRQKRYLNVCRQPLEYEWDKPLQRLVNLKTYASGAYEIETSRVLVYVKNLGAKKTGKILGLRLTFPNSHSIVVASNGTSYTVMEVGVFDDTESATLTLFRNIADSATTWIPSYTILLLTNLRCNARGTRNYLLVQSSSFVEVNPQFPDSEWLRDFAIKSDNESRINPPFPSSRMWSFFAFGGMS